MRRRIAIVTDSTACVSPEAAERLGISVVQLQLQIGEYVDDEARVGRDNLVAAMRGNVPVATSPPPPPAFFWTYRDAVARGIDAVVSIHISSRMSETCNSARIAAAEAGIPVHVVDSGITGMSLGYAVMMAAHAAAAGAGLDVILPAIKRRCREASEFIYVDTLEYLRRGGRIGAAAALLGTALSIKPLLTVVDGQVAPLDKVRGTHRALSRLAKIAVQRAGTRPVDVAVEHFDSPKRAQDLAERLRKLIPNISNFTLTEVSSIIGAHVGPGALGVSVAPC